jgi:hypothetical protein
LFSNTSEQHDDEFAAANTPDGGTDSLDSGQDVFPTEAMEDVVEAGQVTAAAHS